MWTYTLSHAYDLSKKGGGAAAANGSSSSDGRDAAANGSSGVARASRSQNKYIDEVRIGGRMYTGLQAERDTDRRPVRRKERVFTYYVEEAGRDVVHRLVEILGSSSSGVATSLNFNGADAELAAADGGYGNGHGNGNGAAKDSKRGPPHRMRTMSMRELQTGSADNLELLYVDGLEEGTEYEPPAFLAPFVSHEVPA